MSRFTGHVGEEWGSFIDIKRGGITGNLAGKTVLIGSVTDPYNPHEKKYEATRAILKRLVESDTQGHIEILTKSPLVLRDIDLLSQLQNISVGISISTCDELFARRIEAKAASPTQRLGAICNLKKAGISVYAFISPIFPYLSNWREVVDSVNGHVDKICFENLNLRGSYRTTTLEVVNTHYPEIYPKFADIYANKIHNRSYWDSEAEAIKEYMEGKSYKIYFYHNEIKKK
jgi:DNA repair photolyase